MPSASSLYSPPQCPLIFTMHCNDNPLQITDSCAVTGWQYTALTAGLLALHVLFVFEVM
jgi:hypothetical protein